jgi:hypothetical protein
VIARGAAAAAARLRSSFSISSLNALARLRCPSSSTMITSRSSCPEPGTGFATGEVVRRGAAESGVTAAVAADATRGTPAVAANEGMEGMVHGGGVSVCSFEGAKGNSPAVTAVAAAGRTAEPGRSAVNASDGGGVAGAAVRKGLAAGAGSFEEAFIA